MEKEKAEKEREKAKEEKPKEKAQEGTAEKASIIIWTTTTQQTGHGKMRSIGLPRTLMIHGVLGVPGMDPGAEVKLEPRKRRRSQRKKKEEDLER